MSLGLCFFGLFITPRTTSSTLTVAQSGTITDLNVILNLTHTFVGDLQIDQQPLRALFDRNGLVADGVQWRSDRRHI